MQSANATQSAAEEDIPAPIGILLSNSKSAGQPPAAFQRDTMSPFPVNPCSLSDAVSVNLCCVAKGSERPPLWSVYSPRMFARAGTVAIRLILPSEPYVVFVAAFWMSANYLVSLSIWSRNLHPTSTHCAMVNQGFRLFVYLFIDIL